MVNERNPEDPTRSGLSDQDSYRSSGDDRDVPSFDRDFDERAPSSGKVALFAVAIALLLGAVFYGLNNTSTHQATNPPPARTAQDAQGVPQAPPGMRDVMPRANSQPGMTTGAVPSQTMPPATAPSTMKRPPPDNAPRQ